MENNIIVLFLFLITITFFIGLILIVFLNRMSVSIKIIKESMLILFLCIFGEIIAGIVLSDIEKFLEVLPGVLVIVPLVTGTRGSIMGTFSSRLTSSLHLGLIEPKYFKSLFLKDNLIKENIFGVLIVSITISILGGTIAHFTSRIFGFQSAGLFVFIFIVLISSLLADITLIITGIVISFYTYRKGLDPDNVLFPLNTTISDVISVLYLVLTVRLII